MRKADKSRKTKQLHLRLAAGELMRIRQDAKSLDMTVSDYVRMCVEVFEDLHGYKVRNVREELGRRMSVWDALSAY